MSTRDPTLERAEQVHARLDKLGFSAAVIGAFAMTAHGYQRETADLDFGLVIPVPDLRQVANELRAAGFEIELREPDTHDALGGVVDIEPSGEALKVQLVNFQNSMNAIGDDGRRAMEAALASAKPLIEGSPLLVAGAPELVALKLYAWDRGPTTVQSFRDARELVQRNALDLDSLRALCERVGLARHFKKFVESP